MESMSIDPAAAAIGSRLVEVAGRGLASGAAASPSLTALAPAGAEEVSMQAATAFAAEAQAMLALNAAAQEELARAGAALTEIARMYSQVDGEAAGALMADGARFAGQAFAAADAAATEVATRGPLMANLVGGIAASNPPSSVLPAAANAASTVLGAGAAPLGSIGSIASAGGAAGTAPASSAVPGLASSVNEDQDESETGEPGEPQPGERLL